MRKLLFILLVVVSSPVFAQFHVGVKAGANVTKVDGKSFKDEFRSGYALGGFAEIKLSKKLYLQPEWEKASSMLPLITEYIKENPKWELSAQLHKYINVP